VGSWLARIRADAWQRFPPLSPQHGGLPLARRWSKISRTTATGQPRRQRQHQKSTGSLRALNRLQCEQTGSVHSWRDNDRSRSFSAHTEHWVSGGGAGRFPQRGHNPRARNRARYACRARSFRPVHSTHSAVVVTTSPHQPQRPIRRRAS